MAGMNWKIQRLTATLLSTDFKNVAVTKWEVETPITEVLESVNGTRNMIHSGVRPEFEFIIYNVTADEMELLLGLSNQNIIFTPDIAETLAFIDMKMYAEAILFNNLNAVDAVRVSLFSETIGEIVQNTFIQNSIKTVDDDGIARPIATNSGSILIYK